MQNRLHIPKHFALLLVIASFAGCASGSNIQSDYDPAADFGSYTTYNIMDGAGPDTQSYESFFSKYMVAAISIEMDKRGYKKADNPDLLVNFNANLQDKTKVTSSPSMGMSGGYYGYRGGFYDPWGGYGYGTETRVSQYTEGTFNIDLVDNKAHRLIWEAIAVGKVTQKDLENLEQVVNEGVPEFFATFPFRAGDPNPVVPE
jgi:hypothetical protein